MVCSLSHLQKIRIFAGCCLQTKVSPMKPVGYNFAKFVLFWIIGA